jgi:methionyl-tRNA formyltransferase
MRPWVTFFSQTGTEIYNVSKKLGRYPDVIITNKPFEDLSISLNLIMHSPNTIIHLDNRPSVEDYYKHIPNNAFVTLHGWLRIVPKEICEKFEIYNLHPANLNIHPHLKGKDPQQRAYDEKLELSGNTIHRCTSELDGGEVLLTSAVPIKGLSVDKVFSKLHDDATTLWYLFLKQRLQ